MPEAAMAISLKNAQEIEQMRVAGRIVYEALQACREACRPGATTAQVNAAAERVLASHAGAEPLFKNYPASHAGADPFPAVTCISVNEQVVHGIPGDRVIEEGDLVSVDCGVRMDGWCGDSAVTIAVGRTSAERCRLVEVTEHVLAIAIENIRPGRLWSQVARLMQNYAERAGLGVIRDFVGHGIGRNMHEEPKVPNFVSRELLRRDVELRPGMVLAVEPMCTLGGDRVRVLDDHWTVVTEDGRCAAHCEHTLAVTETGCRVLTNGA